MRQYARLKEPHPAAGHPEIFKIMLYEAREGVYLFLYDSPEAVQCVSDRLYDSPEALHEDWDSLIDERGWMEMEDPLPGCQHDAFIPLRVKGRDAGKPEWGRFETLKDGVWVAYIPG